MIAVLESLRDGKFNPEKGGSLESYIYGITLNKMKDHFKFLKKNEVIRNNPINESEFISTEVTSLEDKELRNLLRNKLNRLKKKYMEVLFLRYYKDQSREEISDKLGIPARRVSERINYAIKLLKKQCEKGNIFSIFFSPFLNYA